MTAFSKRESAIIRKRLKSKGPLIPLATVKKQLGL